MLLVYCCYFHSLCTNIYRTLVAQTYGPLQSAFADITLRRRTVLETVFGTMLTPPPVGDGSLQAPADNTAKEINQELLRCLIAGLVKDSEVDLESLIPPAYTSQMQSRRFQSQETGSKAAQLNLQAITSLLSQFVDDPASNMLYAFPLAYDQQRRKHLRNLEDAEKEPQPTKRRSKPFFAVLEEDKATSFGIVAPLSAVVKGLLENVQTPGVSEDPVKALKRIVKDSECLHLGPMGKRVVAKLSDDIAVKITSDDQINHCTALQQLAEHAPDIPAPKPHGLIRLASVTVMFTSYVPKITLTEAWPSLTYQQKVAIQSQLDEIFTKVRRISRDDRPLGMLDGRGVVDERGFHDSYQADATIRTVPEFEEFVFSYRPWVTSTFVRFLRTLLPASRFDQHCVLTHCDVRPDNIMVDTTENGDWEVTGIIDWEEAGFYPPYWESVKSTRTFLANQENDWYLLQPQCIAPSSFPTSWLVDRLWEDMMQFLGRMDRPAKKYKTKAQT